MHTHRFFSFLTAAVLGLGAQAHAAAPAEPARPLRILLTTDDGINGAGMRILRDTLCAAGHQVTVVAPSADRSGSSGALTTNVVMRTTRGGFPCGEGTGASWAVTGTPVDSVLFGLSVVFREQRPDLVISGMNYGQNVGRAVNHSGTVGAAVAAAEEGVPSLAVSIGLNLADSGTGFSQTLAAAPHVATYVKDLAERLRDTVGRDERLLPDRVALNVNYPVVLNEAGQFDPAQVEGPTVTSVGHAEVIRPTYLPVPNAPDTYIAQGPICGLATECAPETQADADTSALAQGEISITPLAVDGNERPSLRPLLRVRLRR
ncbi:acid phosphatase [Pyxidicoccus fallax]|uniref:5'-nucleotidase SurE n=1 Tax=Pyxidicoccus fallax TaxID=394095 RepID=A0A848LDM3_9BACT|nr:5'/3'-nucleotidase SurE [Pyxidicoccus fallax]NMO14341.1 acid phosphatase [Pyxidicoccus fallax]NPC82476.1 acid phosphatase [Pyxidicoccus fallax]